MLCTCGPSRLAELSELVGADDLELQALVWKVYYNLTDKSLFPPPAARALAAKADAL
eukprot:gene53311-66651_t